MPAMVFPQNVGDMPGYYKPLGISTLGVRVWLPDCFAKSSANRIFFKKTGVWRLNSDLNSGGRYELQTMSGNRKEF